ncbi:MAG TPA: O-antigen ligase family protein [Anaerolineaceae bacterium]|nr:O-antigen ligase family protein [Anaerolineaceae bacterium]HPN50725.1 O-antigen ligase family protein [Anaerolineaceae bacterium]
MSKISRYCLGIMEAAWLAALICTPLFFNKYSSRSFEPDKAAILRSLALIILLVWLVKFIDQKGWRLSKAETWKAFLKFPLTIPVIALAAVLTVSTMCSFAPINSFWGSYLRLQGLYTILAYMVVFASVAFNLRTRAQMDRLITTAILTSLPISLYGIGQSAKLDPTIVTSSEYSATRVTSNLGAPVFLAAYTIMVLPLTIARLARGVIGLIKDRARLLMHIGEVVLYAFVGITQVWVIVLSESRGPLLGMLIGLFFFLLALFIFWRKRWVLWSGVGLAAAAIAFLLVLNIPNGPLQSLHSIPALSRFGNIFNLTTGSNYSRTIYWQMATELIMPHQPLQTLTGEGDSLNALRPLIGYGPETTRITITQIHRYIIEMIDRFHNLTWDTLSSSGVLGLVIYHIVFAVIFYIGLKGLGLIPTRRHQFLFFASYIVCGLVGAISLSLWQDIRFVGLGLQLGVVMGPPIYLVLTLMGPFKTLVPAMSLQQALPLAAVLAAILSHLMEIAFSFQIVSTYTHFWLYAGLVVVMARYLPVEEVEETAPEVPSVKRAASFNTKEPIRSKPRGRSGAEDVLWGNAVMGGLVVGLVLSVIGYNFILKGPAVEAGTILWNSLIYLAGNKNNASFFVPGLLMLTCTAGAAAFAFQSWYKNGEWLKPFLVIGGTATAVSGFFWLWMCISLSGISNAQINSFEDNLARVVGYENLLTNFFVFIFILLVAYAGASVFAWQTRQTPPKPSVLAISTGVVMTIVTLVLIYQSNLSIIQADISYAKAEAMFNSGNSTLAVPLYEHSAQLAPMVDEYQLAAAKAYLDLATRDNTNDLTYYARAEKALLRAVEINPTNVNNITRLSELYARWVTSPHLADEAVKNNYLQKADAGYAAMLRLSPRNYQFYTAWAYLDLTSLGRLDEARWKLVESLRLNAYNPSAFGLLGDIYARQARAVPEAYNQTLGLQALKYYWLASRTAGYELGTKYVYLTASARVMTEMVQYGQAMQAYLFALKAAPDTDKWKVEEALARLYANTGNKIQAVQYAQAAVEHAPEASKANLQILLQQIQNAQ